MNTVSKFAQETLLKTTKIVSEGIINYTKQNVNFGFETKVASQSSSMQQQTSNVLGAETSIQASVQGAHKTYSKAVETLGLEASLLNAALNPENKINTEYANSKDRRLTDMYYINVKKLSEEYKKTILATDNLYDKIIKQYYKDIEEQGITYSKSAENSQNKNNELLKEYYNSIKKIVDKNLGGDWKNELKLSIKTQEYYILVRSISLALKTYEKIRDKKNKTKQNLYYKALTDFSTFNLTGENKDQYNIRLGTKDNYDVNNSKTDMLVQEKWEQDERVYKQNTDTLSGFQTMWKQDPGYVNLKNVEGKYNDLVDYINKVYLKYLTGELSVPEDNLNILPEELSKISQTAQKRWEQYHSYDTISPEMRAAIIKSQDSNVNVNDLEAVKNLIVPKQNIDIPSHNTNITKNYLENKEFVLKKEVNVPQGILKKGFTVINSAGESTQIGDTSPEKPYSKIMEEILNKSRVDQTGAYRFFFEKLHGRKANIKEGFNKRNLITAGKKFSDMENRMVFPAYIDAYNDSYDVNANSYEFSGRAEPFWIYKSTGRTLSISFFMISDFSAEMLIERLKRTGENNPSYAIGTSSTEIIKNLNEFFIDWGSGSYQLPKVIEQNGEYDLIGWKPGQYSGTTEQMWHRMTFLAQCCYPWFRKDGKLKEQPLVRVRIGDFIDQVIKIKSLQFDEYEEFNMDLTGQTIVGAYPMGVKCVIQADIIHSEEPHSNYEKFYWRKDFDIADKVSASKKPVTKTTNEDKEEAEVPSKVKEGTVLPYDLTRRLNNLSNLTKTGSKSDIDNTNVRKSNGGVYRNEGKKVEIKKN